MLPNARFAILLALKAPWPIGLRVVFGFTILGFLVSTGQLVHYFLILRVFPHEIGGKLAIVDYILSYVTITLGGFRLRRLFTFLLTARCLYSIPLTAFFTWPMVQDFWQEILSGRRSFASILTSDTWYLIWNTTCLSIDIGVLLYLLSYEFKLFGPGKIKRPAT